MLYDPNRSDIALSEWDGFRENFPRHLFDEVIDREDTRLPDWFMPLAWGGVIASDELLRKAGHRPDLPSCGWHSTTFGYFWQDIGPTILVTRRCGDTHLWSIERWDTQYHSVDAVLCFGFGSTPIMTWTYLQAMRLAMHCDKNELPFGLRWIESPDHLSGVTGFIRMRRFDEQYTRYKQERDHLRDLASRPPGDRVTRVKGRRRSKTQIINAQNANVRALAPLHLATSLNGLLVAARQVMGDMVGIRSTDMRASSDTGKATRLGNHSETIAG